MTAADYSEWCDFAGLYLGNLSHADRYRTFQKKISPAGFVTRVVHDFLRDNDGGIDLQGWRAGNVYEIGADAAYRLEQTALALEAIGTSRVAAGVRSVRDTSIGGMLMRPGQTPEGLRDLMKNVDAAQLVEEFRANVARAFPEMAGQAGFPAKKPVPPAAEIESWEQVEHLLERYVQAHQED